MKANHPIFLVLAVFAAWKICPVAAQGNRIDPTRLDNAERLMLLYMPDPFDGTWKLNAAKSKFVSGPALKSDVVEIEEKNGGIECTMNPVNPDGKARTVKWIAKYDGRDYPAEIAPYADMVALNRIDEHTVNAVYKKGGKEIFSERWVVSGDGKMLTMTQTGKNPPAQGIRNTLVYQKRHSFEAPDEH